MATVNSAKKLEEKAKVHIRQFLTKRYSAKEIKLIEKVDEEMLGRFKIEANDEVIDLTLRHQKRELQEHLTK